MAAGPGGPVEHLLQFNRNAPLHQSGAAWLWLVFLLASFAISALALADRNQHRRGFRFDTPIGATITVHPEAPPSGGGARSTPRSPRSTTPWCTTWPRWHWATGRRPGGGSRCGSVSTTSARGAAADHHRDRAPPRTVGGRAGGGGGGGGGRRRRARRCAGAPGTGPGPPGVDDPGPRLRRRPAQRRDGGARRLGRLRPGDGGVVGGAVGGHHRADRGPLHLHSGPGGRVALVGEKARELLSAIDGSGRTEVEVVSGRDRAHGGCHRRRLAAHRRRVRDPARPQSSAGAPGGPARPGIAVLGSVRVPGRPSGGRAPHLLRPLPDRPPGRRGRHRHHRPPPVREGGPGGEAGLPLVTMSALRWICAYWPTGWAASWPSINGVGSPTRRGRAGRSTGAVGTASR